MFKSIKLWRTLRQLKSANWETQEQAVKVLVRMDKAAVEPLLAALNDKNSAIRGRAAAALGQIGDARVVEPLLAALNDQDSAVRERAARALGRIGDARAVEPLLAALNDQDRPERSCSEQKFPSVEPLLAALNDQGSSAVRRAAARALGQIGDARAVEPLLTMLKDGQKVAVEALGQMGKAAVEPLRTVLKDEDTQESIRQAAVEELRRILPPGSDAQMSCDACGSQIDQFGFTPKDTQVAMKAFSVNATAQDEEAFDTISRQIGGQCPSCNKVYCFKCYGENEQRCPSCGIRTRF
jgi:HEAT repeat protein